MKARSPGSIDEALRSLEALARNFTAGVQLDDTELAHTLDALCGGEPSAQVHALISVLRSTRPTAESSEDARRRFFHATRALASGLRENAA